MSSLLSSLGTANMYLFTKMLAVIVLSGIVGALLGWALGKIGRQKRIARVERDWRRTLTDTEEEHSLGMARFKRSNGSLEDESNNLRTKIAALNAKIDQNREDVERSKNQHRQLSGQINQSQSEMNTVQTDLAEERAKNHKLQNLTKALKSSADEKDRIAQRLSMQLADSQNELQAVTSVENSAEFANMKSELTELRTADRENGELRKRIAIESREREEAQSQLHAVREQANQVEREREEFRQWSIRLEQEQAGFDQRVQHAVTEALSKENSQANDLELEVARLRPMVTELRTQNDKLESANRQLITDSKTRVSTAGTGSSDHIKELQASVDKISYERDQLRTQLADQKRQTQSLNSQLSGSVNPPEVAGLRREIAELSAEKGIMSATITELEDKLGL